MKSHDVIDEALRAILLEKGASISVAESGALMQHILSTNVEVEMSSTHYTELMTKLKVSLQSLTFGRLLVQQMELQKLATADLIVNSKLPSQVVEGLLKDELYTNNVPVMLLINLLKFLRLSFKDVEDSIYRTFDFLQQRPSVDSLEINPAFRRGAPAAFQSNVNGVGDSKELFENKESLEKFMTCLNELLNK